MLLERSIGTLIIVIITYMNTGAGKVGRVAKALKA